MVLLVCYDLHTQDHLLRHYEHFHVDLEAMAALRNPPDYDWRDERAANDFAAESLMPATTVTQEFEQAPILSNLAKRFRVSKEAMGFGLVNLGLR